MDHYHQEITTGENPEDGIYSRCQWSGWFQTTVFESSKEVEYIEYVCFVHLHKNTNLSVSVNKNMENYDK